METVKTLRVKSIPSLVVPVELPVLDDDGDAVLNEDEIEETIVLNFEVKRQTGKSLPEILKKSNELTKQYHDGELDDMQYAERMFSILCLESHWETLELYDISQISQVLEHVRESYETFKKKHGGKKHIKKSNSRTRG